MNQQKRPAVAMIEKIWIQKWFGVKLVAVDYLLEQMREKLAM